MIHTLAAMTGYTSCPTCAVQVAVCAEHRPSTFPFCSQRCRNLDIAAWADGTYVVEGRSLALQEDDVVMSDDEYAQLRQRAAVLRGRHG